MEDKRICVADQDYQSKNKLGIDVWDKGVGNI
jgi:hypothetical protein